MERAAERHPEWGVTVEDRRYTPDQLQALAETLRQSAGKTFWRTDAGRFAGWQDMNGAFYDYGFTFVNLEAVYYGFASPEQAESIFAWLDGKRTIRDDTSTGADIYRWRFGPRATTKRNTETYVWCWSKPENILFGDQVQDGGAVLGFSYFDLMARIKTNGPDDAWRRLREILAWFDEVQQEGGYRAYYAKPGRGILQGGGPPGGLGMDQEFMESVMVPQVMVYGFMGLKADPEGLTVHPRLPTGWSSLTISGVRIHDHVVDLTVYPHGRIQARSVRTGAAPLRIRSSEGSETTLPGMRVTHLDAPRQASR